MDTKLTKRYTIMFLLILNIVLFVINILARDDYSISKQQKDSILAYTNKENIELNFKIKNKYYPMRSINMKKVSYNEDLLKKIFFDTKKDIDRQESFESIILSQDEKILNINNFFVYFGYLEGQNDFILNENNARKIAKKYKKEIEKIYGKLYFDNIKFYSEYIEIDYSQKVKEYKVFNNVLNIKIYKDGSLDLYFNFYKNIKEKYEKVNICSPDEAIYTFSKEIRKIISDKKIIVKDMELGYYLKDYSEDISFIFNPYYRFLLDNGNVFYVNAYTNTFEYDSNFISGDIIF